MTNLFRYIAALLVVFLVILAIWQASNYYRSEKVLQEISQELSSDIIFGNPDATNNIIVFFDYNCGYCQKFMTDVYPELEKDVLKKNDVKITLRLVCRSTDVKATVAYQTAICLNQAGGNYAKLHLLLMYKPAIIYTDYFSQIREEYIGTNELLAECILNEENEDVKRNIYQFQQLQTRGTPTFIIGKKVIKGFKNLETFISIIESELN